MKTVLLLLLIAAIRTCTFAAEVAATPPSKPADKPSSAAPSLKTNAPPAASVTGSYSEHDPMLEFQKVNAKKGYPQSQYAMALRYLSGNGVPKDEAKARELLEAASKQGHLKSRQKLLELKQAAKNT